MDIEHAVFMSRLSVPNVFPWDILKSRAYVNIPKALIDPNTQRPQRIRVYFYS